MNEREHRRKRSRMYWIGLLLCAVAAVSGCQTVGFYSQAIRGQCAIVAHEQSIDKMVTEPATPERLRRQLQLVQELRTFADKELKLPVDKQYTKFVDVHRDAAVWNVQAAPRFSLQSKSWWYLIVGSQDYRGYFSETNAWKFARQLSKKGFDVSVEGADAYSTLGWFRDPVLSTFVFEWEPGLAEVIFHELGHQRVFASGDTDFNEAFATTVGQEGASRWLRSRNATNLVSAYAVSLQRNDQFVRLIQKTRTRLMQIYGDTLDEDGNVKSASKPPAAEAELEAEKRRAVEDLRSGYVQLKAEWGGYDGYDAWFERDLNNAQLNTVADYYDYVPSFKALLRENGDDLQAFYKAAEKLAKTPKEERHRRLRELAAPRESKALSPKS